MIQFLQLISSALLRPLVKPLARIILGFIAIPIFRLMMRKVVRVQEFNEELEKDLEQWFRGSLLLLIATDNMEGTLFPWLSEATRAGPFFLAGRLLLAIGVIEGMPDQALFSIIHPGPKMPKIEKGRFWGSFFSQLPLLLKGLVCQHLNRSSPVLAILCVLQGGELGWVFYGMAIAQYLLIGLVTSRDKALDVLSQFDAAVAQQREEIASDVEYKEAAVRSAAARLRSMDPNADSH